MSRRWRYRIATAILYTVASIIASAIGLVGDAGLIIVVAITLVIGGWIGDLLWQLDVADTNERARLGITKETRTRGRLDMPGIFGSDDVDE